MPLQTILFNRKKFTLEEAIKWLDKYTTKDKPLTHKKVDVKKNFYRFRQRPPKDGANYYSMYVAPGVQFVFYD